VGSVSQRKVDSRVHVATQIALTTDASGGYGTYLVSPPTTSIWLPASPAVYQIDTGVIQEPGGPPKLVLTGFMESYPPGGGDLPIVGLDWNDLDDTKTVNGETWTDSRYRFTGTSDGTSFVLTEPPVPAGPPTGPTEFTRFPESCVTDIAPDPGGDRRTRS
jgi:hypothetical protein